MLKLLRVFGGKAAKQRAESFAQFVGGKELPLENIDEEVKSLFGLDDRDQINGVTYTYGVVKMET